MFITQRQGHQTRVPAQNHIGPPCTCPQKVKMAQNPKKQQANFGALARDYGTLDFQDMLAEFITQVNRPGISGGALWDRAHDTHIPFTCVSVFHKIKFTRSGVSKELEIVDIVHVWPEQNDLRRQIIPAHFDTVLVETNKGPSVLTNICTSN